MTKAPVALVASLRETSVLFATLIGARLLHEKLTPRRWAGVLAVVLGVVGAEGGVKGQAARRASTGATCWMPMSFSVCATALTTLRISLASIAPMHPTRNVSTCVSLPG